jgi:hypothetical protein
VSDPALVDYCDRIEREFFRLKARPGTLSPSDFARVNAWFRDRIPLSAALEGIRASFEAQAGGRNREEEEVNSLAFCEPFVQAVLRKGSVGP